LMKHSEVSNVLAEHGFIVTPDAVERILSSGDPGECISRLAGTLDPTTTMVISLEQVLDVIDIAPYAIDAASGSTPPQEKASPPGDTTEFTFEILRDSTGDKFCGCEYQDFVLHFQDRFNRTARMFRDRFSPVPIEVVSGTGVEQITVVGMVSTATETKNGHLLVELEDTSGAMKVLVSKDSPLRKEVHLLTEDVIAVHGKMSTSGLFIADSIDFQDVGLSGPKPAPQLDACVAFTSDLHIGSREFLADRFRQFVDVLAGREVLPGSNGRMERVRYLLVAGDIVDGVGVYPGQHEDLEIDDVVEQYREAAKFFSMIPREITVFICPGNHDAVRQAVPQPALPQRFRDGFGDNVHFTDNPVTLSLGGHRVIMNHGRSFEDLTQNLPGIKWTEPYKAMTELLRRRHIMPVYGGRVPIAPESVDRFVLAEVPHVIHMGHTHTFGVGEYHGVKLINAGCWQSQTDFQRRMDIQPEPGKVPVLDLSNGAVSVYDFLA